MIPNLIHPVPITIQQLNKSATFMDDDFREPVQRAAHTAEVIVPGQIKWGGKDSLVFTRGGVQESSNGYVLFRYVDLVAAGITLKDNDRMVKLGNIECDVYIIRLEPCGHYPDVGGASMVKAHFADRQPSRQGLGV
jgi:hypothetical protein